MIFRAGCTDPDIEFVAINDLTGPEELAYLLKHDSVHGMFKKKVGYSDCCLKIDGKEIPVYAKRDPANIPWKKHKVDLVVECTGFFRTTELATKHIKAGAKKVLISAPAKDDKIKTIVKGVNEHEIDKKKDKIISNASCTTNCTAPLVKVLHDNFGIKQGFLTTVHAYTGTQRLMDAPHKDPRRGRCAAVNIVPTTTGAAKAVTKTIPELKGKLDGIAMRVPIPCGSITDFVCTLKKKATVEEVNKLFKNVSKSHLKGVLQYSEDHLVSSDIVTNPYSTIFDAPMTRLIDGKLLKVVAWYDNEWGYSSRMIDVAKLMF